MRHLFVSMLIFLLLFGFSHSVLAQEEITFLAPRPVQGPIGKLIKQFEATTNYKVRATWDSGLGTKKLVAEGKQQDVSVMFSPFDDALASGNVDKNSGQTLMKLVMAVSVKKGAPKPDISNADAVKKMLLSVKSIGTVDPAQGSVGVAAMAIFERLGIKDQVQPKLKIYPTGAGPQASVASGEIDVALGPYVSDIRNTERIDVVGGLPESASTPTAVVGYLSTQAKNSKAAKALLDFITKSPEAVTTYKEERMTPGNGARP